MAGSDASEGQAVWQSGGAEEDSRLREGSWHLHLAYDDEEEDGPFYSWSSPASDSNSGTLWQLGQKPGFEGSELGLASLVSV